MNKQTKYTESAKGQNCTVKVFRLCKNKPDTVELVSVDLHYLEPPNLPIHAVYACSSCAKWLQGGYAKTRYRVTGSVRDQEYQRAILETQRLMVQAKVFEL